MGNPEWVQVEMFQDMFARAQNADVIYPLIEEWTMQHGKREIMERCQADGVPVTAVFTVDGGRRAPALAARGYLVELEHPRARPRARSRRAVPAAGEPGRAAARRAAARRAHATRCCASGSASTRRARAGSQPRRDR